MTKLFRHIICALFLLNVVSAGASSFYDSPFHPGTEQNPFNTNSRYSEYENMFHRKHVNDKIHEQLFDGQMYTAANEVFGGVTTLDDINGRAYVQVDKSSVQTRSIAPPKESPVGDAVIPMLVFLLAYGVWKGKRWKGKEACAEL